MGTPPNQTGKQFPDRRSATHTAVVGAISSDFAAYLLDELIALESADIKQLRKRINNLFPNELEALFKNITAIRAATYEIRYEKSPKGIAAREARKLKLRNKK